MHSHGFVVFFQGIIMTILIHKKVLAKLPNIVKDDFALNHVAEDEELSISIFPTDERHVHEYYLIQYSDADDNEDFHQLLINGFDEDKLTEILRFIKQYAPEFEWVEVA